MHHSTQDMAESFITKPISLTTAPIQHLVSAARGEGYRFVDRLLDEWRLGSNRFDQAGEALMGVLSSETLIAIGGLNRDAYGPEHVARIRHVYILPAYRRKGVGRELVTALLSRSQNRYTRVRLRVSDAMAAKFYEAIGFCPTSESDATHTISVAISSRGE